MTITTPSIDSFTGEYAWLSNFYPFAGRLTAEHIFQSLKTWDRFFQQAILMAPTPQIAKRLGRQAPLLADWDQRRLDAMRYALRVKFASPELAQKLLVTWPAPLIEGNWWGDTFWGTCQGRGENWLGRLLMELRSDLKV